jgi:Calpain family cysteine protease
MHSNPDGAVTVTLFQKDMQGKLEKHEVRVDPDLLVSSGPDGDKAVYASSADPTVAGKPEMWVPLLEKAYAQLKGGYDQIGNGGDPADALEALTGVKSKTLTGGARLDRIEMGLGQRMAHVFKVNPELFTGPMLQAREKNKDAAWERLRQSTERKDPMVATTYHEPELLQSGLLPMHAYTVVGVEEKDGRKLVALRNPAPYIPELEGNEKLRAEMMQREEFKQLAGLLTGTGTTLPSLHYGTFTIRFEEFQRGFSNVSRVPVGSSG